MNDTPVTSSGSVDTSTSDFFSCLSFFPPSARLPFRFRLIGTPLPRPPSAMDEACESQSLSEDESQSSEEDEEEEEAELFCDDSDSTSESQSASEGASPFPFISVWPATRRRLRSAYRLWRMTAVVDVSSFEPVSDAPAAAAAADKRRVSGITQRRGCFCRLGSYTCCMYCRWCAAIARGPGYRQEDPQVMTQQSRWSGQRSDVLNADSRRCCCRRSDTPGRLSTSHSVGETVALVCPLCPLRSALSWQHGHAVLHARMTLTAH